MACLTSKETLNLVNILEEALNKNIKIKVRQFFDLCVFLIRIHMQIHKYIYIYLLNPIPSFFRVEKKNIGFLKKTMFLFFLIYTI